MEDKTKEIKIKDFDMLILDLREVGSQLRELKIELRSICNEIANLKGAVDSIPQ